MNINDNHGIEGCTADFLAEQNLRRVLLWNDLRKGELTLPQGIEGDFQQTVRRSLNPPIESRMSKNALVQASEIPRNEPRRLLRDAMTRDEDNAEDGRFSSACMIRGG